MDDNEIYNSEEYKARIERAKISLLGLTTQQAFNVSAESIAYWQMRAVQAEALLLKKCSLQNKSNRHE